MRTEQDIFHLILSYAEQDDNIRAVILNGSRANPAIQKDLFQDFDVAYFVREMAPLIRNQELIEYFGERMILHLPDEMGIAGSSDFDRYGYLMQFMDGNRIDLSICALDKLEEWAAGDSLTVVLLDKDGRVENQPPSSDLDYIAEKPSGKGFQDCCNEFWWLNPYVAKGLWRRELIYARYFLDCLMRGELMKMLEWSFGLKTGFMRSMGKHGKFLREVLDVQDWQMLEATYTGQNIDQTWQALFAMGDLFRKTALEVAENFGFSYPEQDDKRVTNFLHQIERLPPGASSFDLPLPPL